MREIYDIDVASMETADRQAVDPARLVGVSLMPHQKTALQRCMEMEEDHLVKDELVSFSSVYMRTALGIYGDMAGSGKSQVMLALIASNTETEPPHQLTKLQTFAEGMIQIRELEFLRPVKTTIIVVPHTLVMQWEGYLVALVRGGLNIHVISRMKALDKLSVCEISNVDIVLVTNTFYDNIAHLLTYRRVEPRRVIIDEADTIAISSPLCIKASFTWFLTASYGNMIFPSGNMRFDANLQRNVCTAKGIVHQGFIRTLFVNLHRNLSRSNMKRIVVKNSDRYTEESMQSRPIQHQYIQSLVDATSLHMHMQPRTLDKSVLQCLDSGDMVGVLQQVAPGNRHTLDGVVSLMVEEYSKQAEEIEDEMHTLMTEGVSCMFRDQKLIVLSLAESELQHKIGCMRNRLICDDVCCICLEETDMNAVVPCCKIKMCLRCIARWVVQESTCVLCRGPLRFTDLQVIECQEAMRNEVADLKKYGKHRPKIQNLEVIMRHHIPSGSKVLVYIDEDATSVCNMLDSIGKTYDSVRGGHKQISNTVDGYYDDRIDVLLLNSTNYGSGLNLENTTDIIMFQTMETEVAKQVIGRAQRTGRTSDLRVWHILHTHEMPDYS